MKRGSEEQFVHQNGGTTDRVPEPRRAVLTDNDNDDSIRSSRPRTSPSYYRVAGSGLINPLWACD